MCIFMASRFRGLALVTEWLATPRGMAFAFIAGAFALRVPLLFNLDLHPDEQTFINVAYDVVSGHLPYLHTWDNKPPLLFFLIAPITAIAHHQIWVVRLFAAALDISTGLIVKSIADRLFGRSRINWIPAIWCFAAISVRDGGGALMSETVALPFLMGGALLLSAERPLPWQGLLGGACLGVATLVRASPAFSAVAVIAVLFAEALVRRDAQLMATALLGIVGGFCALGLVLLPYLAAGEMDMLVRSAVLAPRAYVHERGQSSLVDEFGAIVRSRSIGPAFLFGVSGLLYCTMPGFRTAPRFRLGAMWVAQIAGQTWGPGGAFYLIVLVPFACIFAAPMFSLLAGFLRPAVARAALVALAVCPALVAGGVAIKRGSERSPMAETRAMLAQNMKPQDTLYLTTDYLLYWLLDRTPPHPLVTHAGNLFRPAMFSVLPYDVKTSADLMRAIVSQHPTWIVFGVETEAKYVQGTEVGDVLQPVLAVQYEREPSPAGRAIYRQCCAAGSNDVLSSQSKTKDRRDTTEGAGH
jgi:4-amino-4-deoxy-L-arabinose transferase-like glycosyltransferase